MESVVGFFVFLIIAVPLILLIVLIAKTNALATRVRGLEQEVLRLRSASQPPVISEEQAATTETSIVGKQKPIQATPGPPRTPLPTPPAAPSAITSPMRVPASEKKPAEGPRTRDGWESVVGGKLLNRVGALALIIGVGFFLKYAFDNNWITPSMRVMLGYVVGVSLLLLGAHFYRKDYPVFAQGLIGAGIAILYLSVFASFNFYQLVSQSAAFVLMSCVTLMTFLHAFRYNSLAISILGWVGGYLTPFMLNTGVTNEIGLFTYIDILQAGLLAIVLVRQSWMVLEILTLLGTYLTFFQWKSEFYSEDALVVTVLFLTLFWLLFYIADVYRVLSKQDSHPIRRIVNIFNAGMYYSFLYALVNKEHHDVMGLLTLILGALYMLPAFFTFRTSAQSQMLRDYFIITVVLIVIATSIHFSGFVTVILWSCEALVLMWCARHWQFRYMVNGTLLFFALIIFKLLSTKGALSFFPIIDFSVFMNKRFLTFVFLSVTMSISGQFYRNSSIREDDTIRTILNLGAVSLFLFLLSAEVRDVFELKIYNLSQQEEGIVLDADVSARENMKQLSLSGLWMGYGILLMIGGLWWQSRGLRILAMAILGMSVLKIFIYDLSFLQTFYRIFSFIGLGVILLAASYMYQRYKGIILGEKNVGENRETTGRD